MLPNLKSIMNVYWGWMPRPNTAGVRMPQSGLFLLITQKKAQGLEVFGEGNGAVILFYIF